MWRLTVAFLFVSLIAAPPLSHPSKAQYDLDVKTRYAEMARLRNVKQAVKAALDKQPWASVVEVGEDYSLWLTNLNRTHRGDFVHVNLTVALRTPAMLSREEHVDVKRVHLSYNWEQMRTMAQDIPDPESIAESKAKKLGAALGRIAGVPEQPAQRLGGELMSTLATTLYEYPNRVEAVESFLIGQKVVRATRTMIIGDEPAASDESSTPNIVSVEVTPNPAAVQETIRFSVSARNATGYRWVFGNGRTTTGRSVTHTFRRPGRYEVKVTALSSDERDTQSVSVNVEAAPHGRLYEGLRSLMLALSSPWPRAGPDWDQLRAFVEREEQASTGASLPGIREVLPNATSDAKLLLEMSRRVLQTIQTRHRSYLLTQYSTALQRTSIYEEQRTNFDVPETMGGGLALFATVARPLARYTRSRGSTSELVTAYRQANHVCPVLRYAIRSSQSVAGTFEDPLDRNLRAYRKTLGLFQNAVTQDLRDRSLEPSRCTK